MNRACFLKETPEFTKMGEIHELFVLALSLVWSAGATPEANSNKIHVDSQGALLEGASWALPKNS